MALISRGFGRRRPDADLRNEGGRIPPGQYLTRGFPVLSAGPTPRVRLDSWTFEILGGRQPLSWTWEQFRRLPS